MAEATEVQQSETSPHEKTQGKECSLGRFLTEAEGWKILAAADTWVGTPYAMVGGSSEKGIKGDCSGTTNKAYKEAGFSYPYQQTSSFIQFAEATNKFRELDLSITSLQAGDVLWWPGHMAIYAPFPVGHPRRDTGVVKNGKAMPNNMYTAFNAARGTPYGPYNIQTFRGDKYRAFRFFLKPGEPGCN